MRPKRNPKAIAAFLLSILGPFLIGSVLAIVFGFIARREIDASGGAQTGRGMATAAIVIGFILVSIVVVVLIVAIVMTLISAPTSGGGQVQPVGLL